MHVYDMDWTTVYQSINYASFFLLGRGLALLCLYFELELLLGPYFEGILDLLLLLFNAGFDLHGFLL
jgi:hypothetical protein